MSEAVWNPVRPEGQAEGSDPQTSTSAPRLLAADQPMTRREARALWTSLEVEAEDAVLAEPAGDPLASIFGTDSGSTEAAPAELAPQIADEPSLFARDSEPMLRNRNRKRNRKPVRQARVRAARAGSASAALSKTRPAGVKQRMGTRAMLTKLMSLGAMVGVAGMLVATSVPANAFFSGETPVTLAAASEQVPAKIAVQSVGVDDTASVTAAASERDDYTVVSLSDQLRKRYGNQVFAFTNNPNGTIQWPFATSVPISSGFGGRQACSFCSSQHMGVDFAPGAGAPIQAIADGVVNDVIVERGNMGVHIIVDHVINGQNIQSYYGHMKWGSPAVAKGQSVTVGQYLGDVGSTGASTGPHLHLEVHIEGTPVDPFDWLQANAN